MQVVISALILSTPRSADAQCSLARSLLRTYLSHYAPLHKLADWHVDTVELPLEGELEVVLRFLPLRGGGDADTGRQGKHCKLSESSLAKKYGRGTSCRIVVTQARSEVIQRHAWPDQGNYPCHDPFPDSPDSGESLEDALELLQLLSSVDHR